MRRGPRLPAAALAVTQNPLYEFSEDVLAFPGKDRKGQQLVCTSESAVSSEGLRGREGHVSRGGKAKLPAKP